MGVPSKISVLIVSSLGKSSGLPLPFIGKLQYFRTLSFSRSGLYLNHKLLGIAKLSKYLVSATKGMSLNTFGTPKYPASFAV